MPDEHTEELYSEEEKFWNALEQSEITETTS